MLGNENGTPTHAAPLGLIPDGWGIAALRDLTSKIGSGATPTGGQDVYLSTRKSFALIRSQNVFDRHFDYSGLAFITDEDAQRLHGVAVQPGDVLLNITGDGITFGRACMAPDQVMPACVNQHVAIIRADKSKCSPGYILSCLTHPSMKDYIESFNAGGSRRAITKGHIESFVLPLPPLPEQRAIAHILGTLDDKIELNRRMNATLEAMARALFQSWFVDFDPVRARAEGRQPEGMDAATAALFPDDFEETELGEVPRGWKLASLGDIALQLRRGAQPETLPAGTPYIGLEHMPRKSLALSDWGNSDEIVSQKSWFSKGDILFGKLRPYFHKVGIALVDGVCSTDIVVLNAREPEWLGQVVSIVSSDAFVAFVTASSDGTKMPRTRWDDMARYPVTLPPASLAALYTSRMQPLLNLINCNIQQSRALIALRDALLPKLLSGELRVGEAERVVAGTG